MVSRPFRTTAPQGGSMKRRRGPRRRTVPWPRVAVVTVVMLTLGASELRSQSPRYPVHERRPG